MACDKTMMKTSKVKCHAFGSSHRSLMIIDSKGKQIHIPFLYVIDKKYDDFTHELIEVTIPTWLAIDRGAAYE